MQTLLGLSWLLLCDPQNYAGKWERPLGSQDRNQSLELAAGSEHWSLQGTSPTSTCVFVHGSLVEPPADGLGPGPVPGTTASRCRGLSVPGSPNPACLQ